jgi:hypothetical protein
MGDFILGFLDAAGDLAEYYIHNPKSLTADRYRQANLDLRQIPLPASTKRLALPIHATNTSTALATQSSTVCVTDRPWLAVLFLGCAILLLVRATGIIVDMRTIVPGELGFAGCVAWCKACVLVC